MSETAYLIIVGIVGFVALLLASYYTDPAEKR